jgi:hypothetical protein
MVNDHFKQDRNLDHGMLDSPSHPQDSRELDLILSD